MHIKFITLNIWHAQMLDATIAFLKRESPDIITLQEVYNGKDPDLEPQYRALDELVRRLHFPYYAHDAAYLSVLPIGNIPEGNAILSRFPIKPMDPIFFNGPFHNNYVDNTENAPTVPRVLQSAEIETPAGKLNIYNVHGPWDLEGDSFSERRRQMSEAIIAATRDKSRAILAGDTNAKPTNQAIRNVEEHLTSVFGNELTTTFNMRHKTNPGYATAAVDMVFVGSDVRVLDKSCPDADISDHLPLVTTLEI